MSAVTPIADKLLPCRDCPLCARSRHPSSSSTAPNRSISEDLLCLRRSRRLTLDVPHCEPYMVGSLSSDVRRNNHIHRCCIRTCGTDQGHHRPWPANDFDGFACNCHVTCRGCGNSCAALFYHECLADGFRAVLADGCPSAMADDAHRLLGDMGRCGTDHRSDRPIRHLASGCGAPALCAHRPCFRPPHGNQGTCLLYTSPSPRD